MGNHFNIANDNSAASISGASYSIYSGDNVGRQMLAQEKAHNAVYTAQDKEQKRAENEATNKNKMSVTFALGLLICMIGLSVFTARYTTMPMPRILSLIAIGWVSLILAFTAKSRGRLGLQDFGLIASIAALGGACAYTLICYNIYLPTDTVFLLASVTTLILGWILKEHILLSLCAIITIGWTGQNLLSGVASPYFWAFPALLAMQLFLTIELKSKKAVFITTLSGVFWIVTHVYLLANADKISLPMAMTGLFTLGILHARIGKTMQDNGAFSGLFQTNIGWLLAMPAAFAFEHYWLNPSHEIWRSAIQMDALSSALAPIWMSAIATFLIGIAICSILRYRAGKQTSFGGLGIVLISAILPLILIFETQVLGIFAQNNTPASPFIGLVIGGVMTGILLGILVNGLRRNSLSMMLFALIGFSAQTMLVFEFLYIEPNNSTVFGLSVLIAAMITGLYGRRNPERQSQELAHVH